MWNKAKWRNFGKKYYSKLTFVKTKKKIRYFSSFPLLCKTKHNKILYIPYLIKHSFSGVIWFSVYKSVYGKMNSFLVILNARCQGATQLKNSQQTIGNVGLEPSLRAKNVGGRVIIKGMAMNTVTRKWREEVVSKE